MSIGGIGAISVAANIIPTQIHDMCTLFLQGKTQDALALQLKYFALTAALFIETSPIPIKTALNLMGKNVGKLRLPLCDMDKANIEILKKEMELQELI